MICFHPSMQSTHLRSTQTLQHGCKIILMGLHDNVSSTGSGQKFSQFCPFSRRTKKYLKSTRVPITYFTTKISNLQTPDFTQTWICNIRLLYKVLPCIVLQIIEHQLDDHQPEEQHGFPRGKRIDEHFLPRMFSWTKVWLLVFQCGL